MADRPTTSTSKAGRPRMRSRSVHLPSCIPVAPKAGKPITKSAQRASTKGKGVGVMSLYIVLMYCDLLTFCLYFFFHCDPVVLLISHCVSS